MLTRRRLLAGALPLAFHTPLRAQRRPKIACISTVFFKYSHTQHFVDRFLEGYGWNGTHHRPEMDLVSLWVDQVGEGDLSRDRAKRHPTMKIYPSIAEALTLGGSKLAVDGVLLIGEHGRYPRNEKGQRLYPRYEFFKEIVKVFRDSGRSVPLFNDKHLSWNWGWAKEMYDTSKELGFAFMAGSSLPVTWRTPPVEMPLGAKVEEAVSVAYGGVDGYDIHALETIQCMVERRGEGEVGVNWLQAYRGDNFWKAFDEKLWSHELMNAALTRSQNLTPAREGFNDIFPTPDDMKRLVKDPVAYHYEHEDGLKCTMLLMGGLVDDFNFAARVEGRSTPLSTQMFLTGKATYPVERTLLTTGLTAAGVESLFQGETRYETPHLAIRYQPTKESTFWRN